MQRFVTSILLLLVMTLNLVTPLHAQAGPSGTGKTLSAGWLANEIGSTQQEIAPDEESLAVREEVAPQSEAEATDAPVREAAQRR